MGWVPLGMFSMAKDRAAGSGLEAMILSPLGRVTVTRLIAVSLISVMSRLSQSCGRLADADVAAGQASVWGSPGRRTYVPPSLSPSVNLRLPTISVGRAPCSLGVDRGSLASRWSVLGGGIAEVEPIVAVGHRASWPRAWSCAQCAPPWRADLVGVSRDIVAALAVVEVIAVPIERDGRLVGRGLITTALQPVQIA